MPIKNADIFRLIEEISEHFRKNINNRYIRKALLIMNLSQSTWDQIESLTTRSDYFKSQGYQFHEIYEQILAVGQFIFNARRDILPNLRSLLSRGTDSLLSRSKGPQDQNRILRDMAINNFSSNLKILADMINELYITTVKLDQQLHTKKTPIFKKIPELKQLGQLLIEP